MMLTNLATVVRASGLRVVEVPGWSSRCRPASTGTFNPRGVLVHHTGDDADGRAYAQWLATTGRADLPAPLSQLALDRKGVVYVLAAGRSNHAGKAHAVGPMPSGDGNSLYIGIEAMNTGSEGWGKVQYDAYVRLCAALCVGYKWLPTHVLAHRETSTTGKWDPGKLDMARFRKDVAARMTAPPKPKKPKPVPTEPLNVGTWNVGEWPEPRVLGGIVDLMLNTDVLCLQQMGGQRGTYNRLRYGKYAGGTDAAASTPIIWHKGRFTLVDFGSPLLSEATNVGEAGAGPVRLKEKRANWVKLLHHATGRTICVVNYHGTPTVEDHGQPSNPKLHADRHRLYDEQMDGLIALAVSLQGHGPLLVFGDFNVNARLDDGTVPWFPRHALGRVGLVSCWEEAGKNERRGTKDKRQIDGGWRRDHDERVTVSSLDVVGGNPDDHRGLVVTYNVTLRDKP